MTLSDRKNLGIRRRFLIIHSLEYCKTSRFGVLSSRMARIIAAYPASKSFPLFPYLPLLSWNGCSHWGQCKSTAWVLAPAGTKRSDVHAAQYSSLAHQCSVKT